MVKNGAIWKVFRIARMAFGCVSESIRLNVPSSMPFNVEAEGADRSDRKACLNELCGMTDLNDANAKVYTISECFLEEG